MKCTEARAFVHVLSFCLHRNSKWIGHLHSLCPLTLAAQLLAPSVSKTKGLLQRMAFHLAVFRLLSMGWTWTGMPQAKVLHTSWCWDLYTSLHAIICCYMSLQVFTLPQSSPHAIGNCRAKTHSRTTRNHAVQHLIFLGNDWYTHTQASVVESYWTNVLRIHRKAHIKICTWYGIIWYFWIDMIWSANMCIDIQALHNDPCM